MTDRIPPDLLTSDALDALYEQLEAAKATETQRQLAVAREALASATTRAARADAAIARVRKVIDSVKAVGRNRTPTTSYDRGITAAVDWVTMRVLEAIDARLVTQLAPAAATRATDGTVCGAYQPPATADMTGLCARCGMYDYKHKEPTGA
ncbi:hypothetical protein ACFW6E_08850 [Streptomyces olivaceoviridis]|uniref:hypothetical protein n=1 Tax=Streptomyces olivaceoviridis TaxID=1921 RepID=UPI003693C692